jgi:hypothetical protein
MSAYVSNGSTYEPMVACIFHRGLDRRRQPELEGLRLHGGDLVDHRLPARARRDQLLAEVRHRADRDPEQEAVEVSAGDERHLLHVRRRVPERLEVAVAERLAALELLPQRLGGPARQALDVDQRRVLAAGGPGEARLPADLHRGDRRAVRGQVERLHAMEELEAHAAALERLVHRGDHDVAHAGVHPPEDRALVAEHESQQAAQGLARGHRRARRIAVAVRERGVVEAAEDRRVERRRDAP